MRVLRGTGIESESELPFAALHQLLRPVAALIEGIPARHAAALRSAFGIGPQAGQDRFLISLGVLSVLAEAAEEGPLLCLSTTPSGWTAPRRMPSPSRPAAWTPRASP